MSKMRLTVVATAVAALGFLGAAPLAGATVHNGRCESGELCGYKAQSGGGDMNDWTNSVDNTYGNDSFYNTSSQQTSNVHDAVRSVRNNRSVCYHMYKNTNQGGDSLVMGKDGGYRATLGSFDKALDSHASYSC